LSVRAGFKSQSAFGRYAFVYLPAVTKNVANTHAVAYRRMARLSVHMGWVVKIALMVISRWCSVVCFYSIKFVHVLI